MSMASPEFQNLAERLVALETAHDNAFDARGDVAVQVIEELRVRLVRLAGQDGFRSLLSRALTLAKAEAPALHRVRVLADGSLEGFGGIEQIQETEPAGQAGRVLVTNLLELLVTFIGESLTLRLVRDAWPDAAIDGADATNEGKP